VNKIGLHIRLTNTISSVAEKADRLDIPYFQTFLINELKHFVNPQQQDRQQFLALRPKFDKLFLHASYWANCASLQKNIDRLLERELRMAQSLQFDYLVLHPGAFNQQQTRGEGIDLIARRLNKAMKKFSNVTILLENVAHTKRSIGGDIQELRAIYDKINIPERLGFCIDTAHAHAYGYDLTNTISQENFLNLLDETLNINNIHLVHFNDTPQSIGSHIDVHTIPGKGKIGKENLIRLAHHPKLKNIPLILELPILKEEIEHKIIDEIRKW